jgi:hypothetical protein
LFPQFCLESKDSQLSLLHATGKFVAVTYPTLLSKTSSILMAYYNNDIVEEEAFLAWAEGKSDVLSTEKHRAVVESATQFLEWLKVRCLGGKRRFFLFFCGKSFYNIRNACKTCRL